MLKVEVPCRVLQLTLCSIFKPFLQWLWDFSSKAFSSYSARASVQEVFEIGPLESHNHTTHLPPCESGPYYFPNLAHYCNKPVSGWLERALPKLIWSQYKGGNGSSGQFFTCRLKQSSLNSNYSSPQPGGISRWVIKISSRSSRSGKGEGRRGG